MTAIYSPPERTSHSTFAAVDDACDQHELEAAWTAGLRGLSDTADRDQILAAVGRRISHFGAENDDRLRRLWLEDVVEEIRLRAGRPLDQELAPIFMAQLREAFTLAREHLAELREAVVTPGGMHEFSDRSPLAAARICDLGRIVERLRGTELTALVPTEDARLARKLANSWAFRHRLLATVPESLRVSREDLLVWAAGPNAHQELPRLIRRLIRETAQVERIEFPSGKGVFESGWDGIVTCAEGNQFVPDGRSVWEVSVQKSGANQKAREDYDKRVERVEAEERRNMHYVAASCTPWPEAADFEEEKRSLGDFRSVRALDVNALEDWLECAPSTTVWMRDLMGKPVAGVSLLSAWWAKWLESTTPPLTAGIVLAGREGPAEALRDRCNQPLGGVVSIGGQVHREEILAFVASALAGSDDHDSQGQTPADALYVNDHQSVKRLLATEAAPTSGPHTPVLTIVVPSVEFAEHLPAGSRHRMIVPIPGGSQSEIVLEAIDAAVATDLLWGAGEDRSHADELGSLARMSLMALRRRVAADPEVHKPLWATGPVEQELRRSLLLHSWDQSRGGDRKIVERLVGRPHDEVAETLNRLDDGDAPMILTGEIRHVVSPADVWMLLQHQLTSSDIEEFSKVAHDVLTAPDPLHGMERLERMLAQSDGVRAKYSSTISRGIATTLALMGTWPPTPQGSITPASSAASRLVRRILKSANEDASPRTWSAVAEVLPLLAEADPEAVLSGLRTCLAERHAFATAMFADHRSDEFGFPPTSPHLFVVETLELLAWSREHLAATADLLARLAATDPGGRWSQRPAASLESIMCTWMPNTSAVAQDRLTVIEMLRHHHGPVAWDLMMSMLPRHGGNQVRRRGPLYRDWRRSVPLVTPHEQAQMVSSVAEMLLQDAGDDAERWAGLVKRVSGLPEAVLSSFASTLTQVCDTQPDEAFKRKVWPELQRTVTRHRWLSEANWAMSEKELAPLDHLLECLRPAEPAIVYGDLFSFRLMFVDGVSATEGWETFQEALLPRQTEAVGTILNNGGIASVMEFANAVEHPRRVGTALARSEATLDTDMLDLMHGATDTETEVALGYFGQAFAAFGWERLDRLINDHDPSPRVVADLHRAPPPVELPWTRVEALGNEVAGEYWTRASYYDIGLPDELSQLLLVSGRLREVGRCGLAAMLLSMCADANERNAEYLDEIADCLEQLSDEQQSASANQTLMGDYPLANLLKILDRHRDDVGVDRVARLEWLYYTRLCDDPGFQAPNIYRAMSQDPDLFVWMVETAYRPANSLSADRTNTDDAYRQMALDAFQVLRSWPNSQFVPSLCELGVLDAEALHTWVVNSRERLEEIDRVEIGDAAIGAALAASPADPDGTWPGGAVRDVIEQLQSDSIDKGFYVAVLNQRGVTSRTLTAGGTPERELARRYRGQIQHLQQWPRTAAIFDALAQSYEREADEEDENAEAHRRGRPL